MASDYAFRPMTSNDLPRVRRWLAEPHVMQWWGDPAKQYDLALLADPEFREAQGARARVLPPVNASSDQE